MAGTEENTLVVGEPNIMVKVCVSLKRLLCSSVSMYYIVRSKLYPVERNVGCQECGSSKCQVCKSLSITEEFNSFATKKTYKINYSFDCNDKCLIYLLSCKSCGKQYVGNTTDHFRSRWNNYKSDVGKAQKVVTWKM